MAGKRLKLACERLYSLRETLTQTSSVQRNGVSRWVHPRGIWAESQVWLRVEELISDLTGCLDEPQRRGALARGALNERAKLSFVLKAR